MPDKNAKPAHGGWVFYDADCRLCAGTARRMEGLLHSRGFRLAPLQAPWAFERLGRTPEAHLSEMALLTGDGRIFGGAEAVLQISRLFWWARWMNGLARLPLGKTALDNAYHWLAARRNCATGGCRVPPGKKAAHSVIDWILLVFLPLFAGLMTWHLTGWVFMWAVAVAMGLAGKWLTFQDARRQGRATPLPRTLGWFLGWPGLDGRAFFDQATAVARPGRSEWLGAVAKLLLGIALIWAAAPLALARSPVLAAWLAMVGIVFCLHFGAFHLASLAWRRARVNAMPIMRNPVAATSLADFWGSRWNTAFSIPARRLVLVPLARRVGMRAATFAVFLLSGMLHELVISLPARGGWGLPMAYFALQGCGLIIERTAVARGLRLDGWRGRAFTFVVTAVPAWWLFHPFFAQNVILPMLQALGAT